MRVLILSHLFPRPDQPWNGIFVAEQAAALRRLGVDARVVYGDGCWFGLKGFDPVPERTPAWTERLGVPCASFRYFVPARTWHIGGGITYAAVASALVSKLRQEFPFDILHAHTSYLDGTAAAVLGRLFRVPVVVTEHSGPFSTQVGSVMQRLCTGWALQRANAVLAVSGYLRAQMQAALPALADRDIGVIGNGVNPGVFRPVAGHAGATVEMIWVGGFHAIKQPIMLLEAFQIAQRRVPGLRLTIVGDGPMADEMRQAEQKLGLAGLITWRGSVERAELALTMARSDFLVVSSRAETFCVAAIEALAAGCPVLTTRCGGPEEIVRHGQDGLIVDNAMAALADGMVDMAERHVRFSPEMLHAQAIERFGDESIANKLIGVYQGLLSGD